MAGERILVADDEQGIRNLLQTFCEREGYVVETVPDGESAIAALDEALFDVCIFDLNMPGASGIDALRHAKEVQPEAEVIILTGFADVASAIEALRLGAYDYIQKPVADLDHLAIVIGRALERQQLARRNERLIRELQAANVEIERRRRRELDYIQQIGQAMASALDARDVLQVLVQAVLHAIPSDAAGGLLLAGPHNVAPWAVTLSQEPLTPGQQAALIRRMLDEIPEELRPRAEEVEVQGGKGVAALPDEPLPWPRVRCGYLRALDAIEGLVLVASRSEVEDDADEAGVLGVLVAQGSAAVANSRLYARAQDLAVRDGLTGLYNHRFFFESLQAQVERAKHDGSHVAVIMVDLDREHGLKAINDTLGHQAGDELLRQVGRALEAMVRRNDIVARYGGDEFVILSPDSGEREGVALAQRVRRTLAQKVFTISGVEARVTASIGAAISTGAPDDDASAVVSRADRGIYQAKEAGGDQVCFVAA